MSLDKLVLECAASPTSAAWEELIHRLHRPISLSVVRTALRWGQAPNEVVDDLVQDTYLKLCGDGCKSLAEFTEQHPDAVIPYVKTVATNLAHDHFKCTHSQKRGSGRAVESIEEIEVLSKSAFVPASSSIERDILVAEIGAQLASCLTGPDSERDREIFWLYYRQGLSAKSISQLPTIGLTDKGVESVIFRLTQLLKKRIVDNSNPERHKDEKGYRAAESF